jgi:hypothetical protein
MRNGDGRIIDVRIGRRREVPPRGDTPYHVRLVLTPEEHQRFRIYSARQGKPMAAVAKQVFAQFLNEEGISRGGPADRREK